jgi:hypothetical protein
MRIADCTEQFPSLVVNRKTSTRVEYFVVREERGFQPGAG